MHKNFAISVFVVLILAFNNANVRGQDDLLFKKHIVFSTLNGLYYGIAIDIITEAKGGAVAGIPIITAGVAGVIPVIANSSRTISQSSLVLSDHGSRIGWLHGFALATLIGGDNAWNDNNYKLSVGLGALTSIGLGIVGNSIGKKYELSEGAAGLYRHYGWIGPFTGISLMAATTDNSRFYGAADLLFGAGGYLLASEINKSHEFTAGDIRATQVLALLNGELGFGISTVRAESINVKRSDILWPAIGLLSGSLVSHVWLKDAGFTQHQGMLTAYAASGGALIGLGIAMITESDKPAPYFFIPYATGLAAYAYAVETLKKKNIIQGSATTGKKGKWDLAFMPQNIILNKSIYRDISSGSGSFYLMQPLFSASYKF